MRVGDEVRVGCWFVFYEKTAASAVKLGGGWGGGRGKARPSGSRGGFAVAQAPEKQGGGGTAGTPSSVLFHILLDSTGSSDASLCGTGV